MASGTRRISTAVGIGATSANILANDTLRYPGVPSVLRIAATSDLVDVDMLVQIGNNTVFTGEIPVERAAGRGPEIPEDVMGAWGVAPADQITVTFTNRNAGAVVTVAKIDVEPA